MLAKFDEEIKLLEDLLKESRDEDEIAVSNGKHSQFPDSEWASLTSVETVNCFSSQNNGDEEMKSDQQLEKKTEEIEKEGSLIQFDCVETMDNNTSVAK